MTAKGLPRSPAFEEDIDVNRSVGEMSARYFQNMVPKLLLHRLPRHRKFFSPAAVSLPCRGDDDLIQLNGVLVGVFDQAEDRDWVPGLNAPGQIGDDFRVIAAHQAEAQAQRVVNLGVQG
jgi:hypothetical protein